MVIMKYYKLQNGKYKKINKNIEDNDHNCDSFYFSLGFGFKLFFLSIFLKSNILIYPLLIQNGFPKFPATEKK